MNRKSLNFTILIMSLFLLITMGSLYAKGPENAQATQSFYKTSALNPTRTLSNINNWAYWLYYDGKSGIDPNGNGGGIYPRGTSNVIYEDGVIWGALVPNSDGSGSRIQVGGSTYRTGTAAVFDQIYRIRSDWASLTRAQVKEDASEFFEVPLESVTEEQADQIIEQYKLDWKNWPVEQGAPYVDVNGNDMYDPVLDENGMADPNKGDYPGIASADQVVYFVVDDSDAGRTTQLYGSDPMGIELQVTMWGYNQKDARLGQLMFKKYKLINKSDVTFDSMYVAQWCDPDVGNYTDDLVGCDPELGLGFAYNGGPNDDEFDRFGVAPSAMGYDFFQGPIVDGVAGQDINNNGIDDAEDYAVFNLKKVGPGKVNIPMTSFGYFSAGNTEWSDPQLGNYNGTLEWYNLLRGFITNTDVENPTPFTHRATGEVTKFPLDGDPATGTGDLDGQGSNFAAADRRMSLSTGPFTMAPGDEQEVVVAVIGGSGSDYINSVVQVKETDKLAQKLYDDLFATIPKAPPAPQVVASPFENTIVLSWGDDAAAVSRTEDTKYADSDSTAYTFQGYNVYQLSFGLDAQTKLIGTFDLVDGVTTIEQPKFLEEFGETKVVPVQFGKDNGVKRYFVVDKNYLTDEALFPGNTYYFAVTAYNYNPDPQLIQDKALESSLIVIPVQTQAPSPGKRVEGKAGSTLAVSHEGSSDGSVEIVVVDPAKATGHTYNVFFYTETDTNSANYGETVWGLRDSTAQTTVIDGQLQYPSGATGNDAPIVDGLQIKVFGPPPGINDWDYTGNRWFSGVNWGGGYFFGGMDLGANFFGSTITDPTEYTNVTLFWAADTTGSAVGRPTADVVAASKTQFPDRWSKGQTYRRDLGYPAGGIGDMPFAAFDMEQDPPRQINVCFVEDANNGNANLLWDMGWAINDSNFASLGGREYTFIMNSDYNEGADYDNVNWGPVSDVLYAIWPQARGSRSYLLAPFEFNVYANHVNSAADKFVFDAPAVEESVALEKEDADKVTVFPNPYYAGNSQETGRFDRFVTFYHLPKKATIRIFNLAGEQVRKLETPSNNTSQFLKWDLRNDNALPVASGMYFAHVDMTLSDGSSATKVLKLFIIQRRQQLEFF